MCSRYSRTIATPSHAHACLVFLNLVTKYHGNNHEPGRAPPGQSRTGPETDSGKGRLCSSCFERLFAPSRSATSAQHNLWKPCLTLRCCTTQTRPSRRETRVTTGSKLGKKEREKRAGKRKKAAGRKDQQGNNQIPSIKGFLLAAVSQFRSKSVLSWK